jgi:hypothetical protein
VVLWDVVADEVAVDVCVVDGEVFSHPKNVPSACLSAISFNASSGAVQSPRTFSNENVQPKSNTAPWLPSSNWVISFVIFSSDIAVALQRAFVANFMP